MSGQSLIDAVRRCSHNLQLVTHAFAFMRAKDRINPVDADDYIRDPRYAVPVSRSGSAQPPIKRPMVAVHLGMSDSKTVIEAKRVEDQIDRLFKTGRISEDSYNAARLFQKEFLHCGYDNCRTTNLAGTHGGAMGIEDIYTRSCQSRDYVFATLRKLGGPSTMMAQTVCHYVGFGHDIKALANQKKVLANQKGKTRDFWTGILLSALEIMGEDYKEMMKGRGRKISEINGFHGDHTVPEHGSVVNRREGA